MKSENARVRIVVAVHKKYRTAHDKMYLPLQVGAKTAAAIPGFAVDSSGENISEKNPYFCELTGLYWAWKNLDADFLGLVHYRRYFAGRNKKGEPFDRILRSSELMPLLRKYSVIVPKKRRYYIETLYSHYCHTHYKKHLDVTKKIIEEKYPEYIPQCNKVFSDTGGYMFNMMIMEKSLFDSYCKWLFDILFELERRIGGEGDSLSDFQKRFYGRVSEIIFNVWLQKQIDDGKIPENRIKELPIVYTEKINYFGKAASFIKAKLFGKKYERSF